MAGSCQGATLVPYGADQTVYVVVDSSGAGGLYRETEVECAEFEEVVCGLLNGQFNFPVRVVAFNTLEHWAEDISGQVAEEIQTRCDIEGIPVPVHIEDFVTGHAGAAQESSAWGPERVAHIH